MKNLSSYIPNCLEYQYKEDLFKFFNVQDNKQITDTPQVWGGSFLENLL